MNFKKIISGSIAALLAFSAVSIKRSETADHAQAVIFDVSDAFADAALTIPGDVNNDGIFDASDESAMQAWLVKSGSISNYAAADFNGDNVLNVFDAVSMRRSLIKKNQAPQTTAAVTTAPVTTATTVNVTTTTVNVDEYVNKIAELVNAERAKKGIPAVTVNAVLTDAAMLRAKEITTKFSHDRPDGSSCFSVLYDFNLSYSYCAENIAAGNSTPEKTMQQWINSEGHYNNLMSPNVTEIGVGYCYAPDSEYRYYWVQLFRKPA